MIAEQIMHKNVYSLLPTNTVREAVNLMHEKKIRHLPITNEENELLGVVSDYDIKEALPSKFLGENISTVYDAPISKIMVNEPLFAHPLDFAEEIALTLYETKMSCMPIVTNGKLVGIVTTTDLLYTYMELTGATIPGSKIDIRVENRPGLLYEITDIFKELRVNVISVLVYADNKEANHSIVSVRIRAFNPISVIEALREKGFHVLWPNMPGITL